jgi:hypothetical protein
MKPMLCCFVMLLGCFPMTPEEKQKISDAGQWGVPPPGKSHPFYKIK